MASETKLLTAVFRDRSKANQAYHWLRNRGYSADEINVLMSEETRKYYDTHTDDNDRISASSHALEGVATGGTIGTALGATLAALAAVGTAIVLPPALGGFIVAGPIAAALAGGGAGAVTGGLIGGLIGLGIPESNANAYEEVLKHGGVALGVRPVSSEDEKDIRAMFDDMGGENIIYT